MFTETKISKIIRRLKDCVSLCLYATLRIMLELEGSHTKEGGKGNSIPES